jgi:hypothetical protein
MKSIRVPDGIAALKSPFYASFLSGTHQMTTISGKTAAIFKKMQIPACQVEVVW